MSAAETEMAREDRLRSILAIAAPVLVLVLSLLSLPTLWFAYLIHSAPLLELDGTISWQARTELILAYLNLAWVGVLIGGYWRGSLPLVLACLAGFVLNYSAWVLITTQVPV